MFETIQAINLLLFFFPLEYCLNWELYLMEWIRNNYAVEWENRFLLGIWLDYYYTKLNFVLAMALGKKKQYFQFFLLHDKYGSFWEGGGKLAWWERMSVWTAFYFMSVFIRGLHGYESCYPSTRDSSLGLPVPITEPHDSYMAIALADKLRKKYPSNVISTFVFFFFWWFFYQSTRIPE